MPGAPSPHPRPRVADNTLRPSYEVRFDDQKAGASGDLPIFKYLHTVAILLRQRCVEGVYGPEENAFVVCLPLYVAARLEGDVKGIWSTGKRTATGENISFFENWLCAITAILAYMKIGSALLQRS